ncbi:MAG: hypothetical protein JO362_23585 [Streptomycetaceae bacterium]|nr:hypothetical protein [Streptomycetaceae bacterium]
MTVITGESLTDEFDAEFDLNIWIGDLNPADPERIHQASAAGSCTGCCPSVGCYPTYNDCTTVIYCTENTCGN